MMNAVRHSKNTKKETVFKMQSSIKHYQINPFFTWIRLCTAETSESSVPDHWLKVLMHTHAFGRKSIKP